MGNRTRLTTPGGTVNYSFDERNRLEQVKDRADTTTYTYDAVNNLVKTLRPNGVEEIREYNSVYQLELLKNVKRDVNGEEVILALLNLGMNLCEAEPLPYTNSSLQSPTP